MRQPQGCRARCFGVRRACRGALQLWGVPSGACSVTLNAARLLPARCYNASLGRSSTFYQRTKAPADTFCSSSAILSAELWLSLTRPRNSSRLINYTHTLWNLALTGDGLAPSPEGGLMPITTIP
jgi:hypothetical protein